MREVQIIPGSRPRGGRAALPTRYYFYNGPDKYVPPVVVERVERPCSVDGCATRVKAKGMCPRHYAQVRRGAPLNQDNRRRVFDPALCGTTAGYARHRNYGVPICQPCRDAKNAYDRARVARQGVKK